MFDPNKYYENLQRKEYGTREPEPLYTEEDDTSHDNVGEKSSEKQLAEEHVYLHVERENCSPEEQELLDNLTAFARETSEAYQHAFCDVLAAYKAENPVMTDRIIEYLKRTGLDRPSFDIYPAEQAQQTQAELGLLNPDIIKFNPDYGTLSPGRFILIFNLPKPLSVFWDKGSLWEDEETFDYGQTSNKLYADKEARGTGAGRAIEWGKLYRSLVQIIWDRIRSETSTMYFERMNTGGQHDATKFYYIFNVANPSNYSNDSERNARIEDEYFDWLYEQENEMNPHNDDVEDDDFSDSEVA